MRFWPKFWMFALAMSMAASAAAEDKTQLRAVGPLVPLGIEMVEVEPAKRPMHLFVAAESEEFTKWLRRPGLNGGVVTRDGKPVERFTGRVRFRVTASAKPFRFSQFAATPVTHSGELNSLLLKLNFRLRAFRGLEPREMEPVSVEMIGMPADIDYDERVWILTYDFVDVPLSDRIFLEARTPEGERISRFYFSF